MAEAGGKKVAIVTGGSGGIGMATGRALAAGGHHVVLSDISPDRGEDTARHIGGWFVTADLARPSLSCPSNLSLTVGLSRKYSLGV